MPQQPLVLAFSGGLDTSFLIPYLKEKLGRPIIAAHVNTGGLGAGGEADLIAKAKALGAAEAVVVDARREFYDSIVTHLIYGNVLRGDVYPLCVGSERVTQCQALVRVADKHGATAIAHGSTSAGNDQVRFEVGLAVLAPGLQVLAPVRDEAFRREDEVAYLRERGFEFSMERAKYSINKGLWGTTIGAREFQDPAFPIPEEAYTPIEDGLSARSLTLGFHAGLPVSIDGTAMDPVALVESLNALGARYGVGRGVHVGNTILGIKGRIAFEAPAATLILCAHRELEKIVHTKWQSYWKKNLAEFYGDMLHEGNYFEPALREIEALFAASQARVEGTAVLELARGGFRVAGVSSPYSMMAANVATYGEEALSWSGEEARGFAKIRAVPQKIWNSAGGKHENLPR